MNLKARLDKSDAKLKERLLAEWRAATRPVREIVDQAPEAEQEALFRTWGKLPGFSEAEWLEICGGVVEPQPGDAELLNALDARIPPDVMARWVAAGDAAIAAGVEG